MVFDPTVNRKQVEEKEAGPVFDPTVGRSADSGNVFQGYQPPSPGVVGVAHGSPFKGSSLDELPIANLDSNKGYASFGTLTKAAFVDDPETKLALFAKDLFPDVPIEQAVQNMGVTADGEIIYVRQDKDGEKLYTATPRGRSFKESGAEIIGKSPTVVGGIGGTLIGAAGGAGYGALPGAMMGAAGGEGVRQVVASEAFGQPVDKEKIRSAMGKEALMSGAGELMGVGLAKYLNRFAARDISRLNRPQVKGLMQSSERQGIQLTPAELTNLRSLKEQQSTLMNLPQSSDIVEDFLTNTRLPQVRRAVDRTLGKISGEATPYTGNVRATQAAREAAQGLKAAREQAASPLYQKAFESGATVPEDQIGSIVGLLNRKITKAAPNQRKALQSIREKLVEPSGQAADFSAYGRPTAEPATGYIGDLEKLHNAKLEIDAILASDPKLAADASIVRTAAEVQDMLTKSLRGASKEYDQGYQAFIAASGPINEFEASLGGKVSRLQGGSEGKAAGILFGPQSSPQAVAQARRAISKQDTEAWNGVVRAHLQEAFEKIPDTVEGEALNLGARFRKDVFGTEPKRRMLKEALEPKQYRAMEELMDVLQATGRAMKGQSITATRQEGMRVMGEEAAGPIVGKVTNVMGGPSAWRDWYRGVKLGNYSEELAQIVTSKDGLKRIRQLKQLPPRSEARIKAIGAMLGVTSPVVAASGDYPAIE